MSFLSLLIPANDLSIPSTARSVNSDIPGKEVRFKISWLVELAEDLLRFLVSFLLDLRRGFSSIVLFTLEKMTLIACSFFSWTSLKSPILYTIKNVAPRFLLHCPLLPCPHRKFSLCTTFATSLMSFMTSLSRERKRSLKSLMPANPKMAYTNLPGTVGLKTTVSPSWFLARFADMIPAPATPQHLRSKVVILDIALMSLIVSYFPKSSLSLTS
mmetsp:Transcript_21465/g.30066  ORF Transcript_21465/g.30066 Transcript_21465/m.30066 type:complete len:214 (-) Transcript_21465:1956-2597(-)